MAFMSDCFENYLLEILNLPLAHRCHELAILIDRSSIKELQDCFASLVQSIFGVVGTTGWGLRTISRLNNVHEFDALYHFFGPLGPMFQMCYRLLNESIKFDVPIDLLPVNTVQMLHTGRYSQFYTDMVQIDPCRRQIVSLSLNAFDYYILHFILHGMVPLHRMYPAAMAVHNENAKTAYFFLTADYLCAFLPSDPNAVVSPTNICTSVKMATQMPVQTIQPTRSPKYLMTSALSQHFTVDSTTIRSPEMPRTFSWRSESVLYFTIDCWLRFNVKECRDLPSSEFISVTRIFVKQLHAFGNSADLDNTSMAPLRQLAQPMMNVQMYAFLKGIIARWPLDSSFSVVLELWLSYIQPWRYTFARALYQMPDVQIHRRYESFITENLVSYTQILVKILPRFERLDFSSLKNVQMMNRIVKVFNQSNLAEILRQNEPTALPGGQTLMTSCMNKTFTTDRSHSSSFGFNQSTESNDMQDWSAIRGDNRINQESYISLFGPEVASILWQLIKKMLTAKEIEKQRVEYIRNEIRQRNRGLIKYLKWLFVSTEDTIFEQTLSDCVKIPDILEHIMNGLSIIFQIEIPNPESVIEQTAQYSWEDEYPSFSTPNSSNILSESLINPSPIQMKKRARDLKYTGDPALIPIRSNEFTCLVRFLHQVSTKLNLMFSNEISDFWNRPDLWGKLSRQILYPPMTVQSFDKSTGISMLCEERLGPRISLRFIASYQTFGIILLSFLFGKMYFGVPSFGFLLLILVACLYILFLSLFNDNNNAAEQR